MKLFLFIAISILFGCSASKPTTPVPPTAVVKPETPAVDKAISKFEKQGFKMGTVFKVTDTDCFSIKLESKLIISPLNLNHLYQKDGKDIWIIYRPVKPKSTPCGKGIPVRIEKIKERN